MSTVRPDTEKIVRRLAALIAESKSGLSTRPAEVIHDEISKEFDRWASIETNLAKRSHLRGISRKHASVAARIRVGMQE